MSINIRYMAGREDFQNRLNFWTLKGRIREDKMGYFVKSNIFDDYAYRVFFKDFIPFINLEKIPTLSDISSDSYFFPEELYVDSKTPNHLYGYFSKYRLDLFGSDQCSELEIDGLEAALPALIYDTEDLSKNNIKISKNFGLLVYDGKKYGVFDTYHYEKNPEFIEKLHDNETLSEYNIDQVIGCLANTLAAFSGDESISDVSNSDELFKHLRKKHGNTLIRNNKRR